jgi:hypothetical protein
MKLGRVLAFLVWLVVGTLVAVCATSTATAYDPGSGSLYSDDFEGDLDDGWEQGNGFGSPSPWLQVPDGGDTSFQADGRGPFAGSPSRHWARHFVSPVEAPSFSIAMEYRSDLGAGYAFDLEVEQRAPQLRKYRLRIAGDGTVSLWRSEGGALVRQTATGPGFVPPTTKRWLRLAIEADAGGQPVVRARVWGGSAEAEPSTWTLEMPDASTTLERVHRFELIADGPQDVRTWVDDLDAFGNKSAGIASSVKTIYLMELSHLDIGFTEPPDDVAAFAKSHLDQVLDNADADPDYHWTIESGWWLDRWWEQSTPAEHERMVEHLQDGQLVLAAGYANLHTTKAGHEEMTRLVYYSSRMAREHGFPLRTLINDDVPGTTFAAPELMARSGLEYYVGGMNTSFGGALLAPDHGDRPFWWVGPDGSRVLSWITFDNYVEAFDWGFSFFDGLEDMFRKMGQRMPELEETGYPYPELLLMRAFDNHYQGFKARNLVEQWNSTYETPKYRLATAEEFLDHMLAKYGAEAFPEYTGDFGAAWARSAANAQHTQDWVRTAHRVGRAGEALAAAGASLDGAPAPLSTMDRLYQKQLEVDEHSGAGGWPGYFTPEEMERNNRLHQGYAEDAREAAEQLLAEGLDRALAQLSASTDAVAVVNPHARQRTAWARVTLPSDLYDRAFRVVDRTSGEEVVYQRFDTEQQILFRAENLPGAGYRVYDLLSGEPSAQAPGLLSVTSTTIENDDYALEVDPATGSLSSMIDKSSGREMIDTGSSYRFNELGSNTDTVGGDPPNAQPPYTAQTSVVESGPNRAAIRVTREGTPHVETIYRLYRGEDRVEIENVLDRDRMPYVPHDTGTRSYVVTLPFDVHDFQLRSETTTRFLDPLTDGFEREGVFDWHNVEHVLTFWDDDLGVTFGTDSAGDYHFENLSALATGEFSTSDALLLPRLKDKTDEYEFEDGSIGPFDQEPDTSPIYRYVHHLRAETPGFDPVDVSRFGWNALTAVPARLLSRRPGNLPDTSASFFRVSPDNVLAYTFKPAEDGDGIVARLTELAGEQTLATLGSDVFEVLDAEALEQDEEGGAPLPVGAAGAEVELQPYQTATVRLRLDRTWAPIELNVSKSGGTSVHLEWSGGVSPFTVTRSEQPDMTSPTTLVDEEDVTSHDDPVLDDDRSYFYLVR